MNRIARLVAQQNAALFGPGHVGQEAFVDFTSIQALLPARMQRMQLLDLGAGNGVMSCRLAKQTGARVVCVDLDAERVRQTRENALAAGLGDMVTTVEAHMDDLPSTFFTNFDVIVSFDAVQHSRDLSVLVKTILAGIHHNAIMLMSMWCCSSNTLAWRWGFGSSLSYAKVVEAISSQRPDAHFWLDRCFSDRFTRYIDFLRREKDELIAAMGEAHYHERFQLVLDTIGAIDHRELTQLILYIGSIDPDRSDPSRSRRLSVSLLA